MNDAFKLYHRVASEALLQAVTEGADADNHLKSARRAGERAEDLATNEAQRVLSRFFLRCVDEVEHALLDDH